MPWGWGKGGGVVYSMTCSMPWGQCGLEPFSDHMQNLSTSACRRVMLRHTPFGPPTNQLFCLDSTSNLEQM